MWAFLDWVFFTDQPGALSNDFFVNLLDMGTEWKVSPMCKHFYEGRDRASGKVKMDRFIS